MKQIILFIFILFSNLNVLKAQDVVINPNDVTLDTLLDFDSDPFPNFISTNRLETNIYNNTNSDIELYWEITQTSGPTGVYIFQEKRNMLKTISKHMQTV